MYHRNISKCTEIINDGCGRGKLKLLPISKLLNLLVVCVYRSICRHRHEKAHQTISSFSGESQFEIDCKILQVPDNCDENQVRSSFIRLAKIYHPDSHGPESSAEKFHQLDMAYKNILQKFADERHNHGKIDGEYGLYYDATKKKNTTDLNGEKLPTEEVDDIEHTTPQHRQYLTYDGFTSGTPYQREKQYQKYRAAKASANVFDHRISKLTQNSGVEETAVAKDQRAAKKIKTSFGMDRLVEDMILESMARGEFDNLSCSGKPLEHDRSYNPYIDFTTHKLNQVLIENGFAPQWILLEKEIREEIKDLRSQLERERHNYDEILSSSDLRKWEDFLLFLKPSCEKLNSKIQKYNLVVPSLYKQILGLQLEREGKKALKQFSEEMRKANKISNCKAKHDKMSGTLSSTSNYSSSDGITLMGLLLSFVKAK